MVNIPEFFGFVFSLSSLLLVNGYIVKQHRKLLDERSELREQVARLRAVLRLNGIELEAETPGSIPVRLKVPARHRLQRLLFQRIPDGCIAPWWMKMAYCDYRNLQRLMVAWPLCYAVELGWWLNLKWCAYRFRESWIDRMISNKLTAKKADKMRLLEILRMPENGVPWNPEVAFVNKEER